MKRRPQRLGLVVKGFTTLALLLVVENGFAQDTGELTTLYRELQAGVVAKVELAGGAGWQETVEFEIYFLSDESEITVDILQPDNTTRPINVYRVSEGNAAASMTVEKCRIIDGVIKCESLAKPARTRLPASGKLLQMGIPAQEIDWESDFLQFSIDEGRYQLTAIANDNVVATVPSPAIERQVLPTLSDLERQFLEQRPFLRARVSPFVRDQQDDSGGFDDVAINFDGGIYRVASNANRIWQLKWEGDVSSEKELSLNRLAVEAGAAQNIIRRDWLPLSLSTEAESDRNFDAVDVSGTAKLAYILPFSADFQSGSYRPSVGPRLEARFALGHSVARKDQLDERDFLRFGYKIRWRVPFHKSGVLEIIHTGTYNDASGADGEWHSLLDLTIELEIFGAAYHITYVDGEAAPLFERTRTTRIGLSIALAKAQE
ncbi:MAG: hypothetical protein OEN01_09120 [Candidatus Krumholzibacteria bacterium]|nr:hypothetical protein [Candidatus Krumholzibacteria bacterium]